MHLFLAFCILSFRSNTVLFPLFNPSFLIFVKVRSRVSWSRLFGKWWKLRGGFFCFHHTGFPKVASECRMMGSTLCKDFDNGSRWSRNVSISQYNRPGERTSWLFIWYTRDAYFQVNFNYESNKNVVVFTAHRLEYMKTKHLFPVSGVWLDIFIQNNLVLNIKLRQNHIFLYHFHETGY